MPTSRVVLYDSFSYLLGMIKRGEFSGDSPNHLYYFGCTGTVEGVMSTAQCYGFPKNKTIEVLEMLARAEQDGRVSWREPQHPNRDEDINRERTRFCFMLEKARQMGAVIPEWNPFSNHFHAYWNLPAMHSFLGSSVDYANPR